MIFVRCKNHQLNIISYLNRLQFQWNFYVYGSPQGCSIGNCQLMTEVKVFHTWYGTMLKSISHQMCLSGVIDIFECWVIIDLVLPSKMQIKMWNTSKMWKFSPLFGSFSFLFIFFFLLFIFIRYVSLNSNFRFCHHTT